MHLLKKTYTIFPEKTVAQPKNNNQKKHKITRWTSQHLVGQGRGGREYLLRNASCGCWSVVAERSSALDSSYGVVRMWVRNPAWLVAALVFLSKTLNHNCFVLRMGRTTVGPVCCVMHVKEPRTLKEKGLAPVFLDSHLEHPAGWICALYKSYVSVSVSVCL